MINKHSTRLFQILLGLIAAQVAFGGQTCFSDPQIVKRIEASRALAECFSSPDERGDPCGIKDLSIREQMQVNAGQLFPYDRSADEFQDEANGVVSIIRPNGRADIASAVKLSRCHVLTSAHLVVWKGSSSAETSNLKLSFQSGQTCDPKSPFKQRADAEIFLFAKTKDGFFCVARDSSGRCKEDQVRANNDLMILRLTRGQYSLRSLNFYVPYTGQIKSTTAVHCGAFVWGNPNLDLPEEKAKLVYWRQKFAKVYGQYDDSYELGLPVNAIAYKGMSGGGCTLSSDSRSLVGIFANQSWSNGKSAVFISSKQDLVTHGVNYLSTLHDLEQRLLTERNLRFAELDRLCD